MKNVDHFSLRFVADTCKFEKKQIECFEVLLHTFCINGRRTFLQMTYKINFSNIVILFQLFRAVSGGRLVAICLHDEYRKSSLKAQKI